MSIKIPPWFTDKFPQEKMEKFCHTEWCLEFFKQVIAVKGISMFFTGTPGSGKSQKRRYFLQYFAPFETIISWDTGKDDVQLLFTLGLPIRFLVPLGCSIELRGNTEVDVEIVQVPVPSMMFDMIRPGCINIISLRNFFLEDRNLKNYVRDMFRGFLLKLRLNKFKAWLPAVFDMDEVHIIMGNLRVDRSTEGIQTGQDTANILRECRSKGLRWLIVSQGFYDLVGTARENTPCYCVNRGTHVERTDNKTLNYLSGFALRCESKHGWIVLPNGRYYGRESPIPFPYFKPAEVRIVYRNFYDELRADKEEVENLFADPGIFGAMMIPGEPAPVIPSRFESQEVGNEN